MRRRRFLALALTAGLIGVLAVAIANGGAVPASRHLHPSRGQGGGQGPSGGAVKPNPPPPPPPAPPPRAPFAVGLTVLRLVDPTRSMHVPGGATVSRTLVTYVRYPASGPSSRTDRPGATPARAGGPFPLIVFGHGFNETPGVYAGLLQAWARAGYVVAAPVFPLENKAAPGGPNESDLQNQPADMSFVISQMLSATSAPSGLLSGLISQRQIAVAGQSDGGDTALAVAYDPAFRDSRVGAAVILSGAEIPFLAPYTIQPGEAPLLATQGTADPINLPTATSAYYDPAPAPKYLLQLLGANHLPPYSTQEPQLSIVERVTTAFLDHYLKHSRQPASTLLKTGNIPRIATLTATP